MTPENIAIIGVLVVFVVFNSVLVSVMLKNEIAGNVTLAIFYFLWLIEAVIPTPQEKLIVLVCVFAFTAVLDIAFKQYTRGLSCIPAFIVLYLLGYAYCYNSVLCGILVSALSEFIYLYFYKEQKKEKENTK